MTSFVSIRDFSASELTGMLDRADFLRAAWTAGKMPRSLTAQRIGLWFYGNGFRNRVAFELGAKSMGATVSFIPGELGVHEPLEDVAGYLSNWFTMLVVRCRRHEDLMYVTEHSAIPVINARTDKGHPCEVLGDLQYVRSRRGSLDGLRVVFVGEATNLGISWLEAASVFPIRVTQVCPKGYEVSAEILDRLKPGCTGEISVSNDLEASLEGADVIYTDCWPKGTDDAEQKVIALGFLPYQITEKHVSRLGRKGFFLPCPPVTRGQEVSAEAMQSPISRNFEAKDDLLHIQNAIMEFVTK